MMEPESLTASEIKVDSSNKASLQLLEFAESLIVKKFVENNDSSRVYALVPINSHFETVEMSSTRALNWLRVSFYNFTNNIHSEQAYIDALTMIKQKSLFDEQIPTEAIHKRIAFTGSEIYYDLCTTDWKLVKVTAESISIVSHDKTTPMFERSKNQSQQAMPNLIFQDNPLDRLCSLLRIKDDLFKTHLITFFIEGIPVPVMALMGMQGSIKSTLSAYIKRLVDPSGDLIEDNLSHLTTKLDDLNIHFSHNYLTAFDNVSFITDEVSDGLCKAITGARYAKRKLYTDRDESIMKFKSRIIINGISLNIDRGDLIERTILYFTQEIPSSERKPSKEIEREFTNLLPDLLGHIFLILQKALSCYKIAEKITNLPRMADFVIWGESVNTALGGSHGRFLEMYKNAMDNENEVLNEGNVLLPFLESQLSNNDKTTTSISSFFTRLDNFARENRFDTKSESFPKGPHRVRGFIERNKPFLKRYGYHIEIFKNTEKNEFTKNATLIKVSKMSSPDSLGSPSLKLDGFTQNTSEHGESSEPLSSRNQGENSNEL